MDSYKTVVHVEVSVNPGVSTRLKRVREWLVERLSGSISVFRNGPLNPSYYEDRDHANVVRSAVVVDLREGQEVSFWQAGKCIVNSLGSLL
jgi:hypothetical protein